MRLPINIAITFFIFIPLFFILTLLLDAWVAGVLAVLVGFCLYFYILDKRVICIKCPHCKKHVETNKPWRCEYKQCWNENVNEYPFIYQCEHCDYVPTSYKCHHCEGLIFFTRDEQKSSYAECVNVPGVVAAEMKKRNAHDEKVAGQVEEISDLRHILKKTELEKTIEIEKNKPAVPPKAKTREEIINEAMMNDISLGRSIYESEKRLKAEAAVKYANDPEGLAEMYRIIEEAVFKYRNMV